MSMKMGKKYNGITGTEADEDYYKMNVTALVAAYKKVKGMTVVSSYSAVKSVKVK